MSNFFKAPRWVLNLIPCTLEVLMSSRSWFVFVWVCYRWGVADDLSLVFGEEFVTFLVLGIPKCLFGLVWCWTWLMVLSYFAEAFSYSFGFVGMCPLNTLCLDHVQFDRLIFIRSWIDHESICVLISIADALINWSLVVVSRYLTRRILKCCQWLVSTWSWFRIQFFINENLIWKCYSWTL